MILPVKDLTFLPLISIIVSDVTVNCIFTIDALSKEILEEDTGGKVAFIVFNSDSDWLETRKAINNENVTKDPNYFIVDEYKVINRQDTSVFSVKIINYWSIICQIVTTTKISNKMISYERIRVNIKY